MTRVNRSWSDEARFGGKWVEGLVRRATLFGKWKLVTDVDALVKSSSAIWERNGNVVEVEGLPPGIERGEWAKN